LKPGDVVIESGTGSGSLTHSLARAVQKSGHVYTFDFHEDRARLAAEEFSSHGLSQVTCQHRDVVQNGFGEDLHNKADAVFLDLPHPWLAVESLELKPGDVVIESGTGSGSLTHSLARAVQKLGHVYTFDFHEDRARLAAEEFSSHGLSQVTCQHRDVVQNGFGEDLHNKADAVFLDLPHPWLAVESAVKSLKPTGGRFCSFSPCIEQVQRTCESLRNLGFVDINTYECLQKEFSVGFRNLPIAEFGEPEDGKNRHKFVSVTPATPTTQGHTGYITSATLPPEAVRLTS
ncbi:tRNA (adenine(58)-N(1))-methyltransferase catalytic subunit TRMT61A, partial [Diaphorina citri]|uniref:tRNA (adenine(58)-N(1))-methyltransferase n=1 Tax=Diaphorina citri TaxID=121845 RepID=A0A1S4EH00_DIACI